MRTISIVLIALFTICSVCKDDDVPGYYDYMYFERQGGGQIDFNVYPTEDTNKLKVVVSKYNFSDTTIEFILNSNTDNSSTFSAFHQARNNQIGIDGDFQQSTLETGTWAYIYFVSNKQTEVTNTDLRNTLLNFEQLVRNTIE